MQQYFLAHGSADAAAAMHSAMIAVGNAIRAQATIMGYSDSFGLLGVILLLAALAVALLRKGVGSGGAAH
jgi:DHA2 family multidrug resistance protein